MLVCCLRRTGSQPTQRSAACYKPHRAVQARQMRMSCSLLAINQEILPMMQSRSLSRLPWPCSMPPMKSLFGLGFELRCALQQLCRLALRHVLTGPSNARSQM